eukprot:SM000004S15142  [mRNA]  locus=s4:1455007:1457187:- [translate_table: standard]
MAIAAISGAPSNRHPSTHFKSIFEKGRETAAASGVQNYGIYIVGAGGNCVCRKSSPPPPVKASKAPGNPTCVTPGGAVVAPASNCQLTASTFGVYVVNPKSPGHCLCVKVAPKPPPASKARAGPGNPTCTYNGLTVIVYSNCALVPRSYGYYKLNPLRKGTCICQKPTPISAPVSNNSPGNPTCRTDGGAVVPIASNCIVNASKGLFGVWFSNPAKPGYCLCGHRPKRGM